MPKPDYEALSDATAGEWRALLAPMLATAARAEDVTGYVVIAVSADDQVELRTNLPNNILGMILRMVTPEVVPGA